MSRGILTGIAVLAILGGAPGVLGQVITATTITYQGQLLDDGEPAADGVYDMTFTLWDAESGGTLLGTYLEPNVVVEGGLFTAWPDFGGAPFNGQPCWLEIMVDTTTLAPRQPLTAAPQALMSHGLVVPADLSGSVAPVLAVSSDAESGNVIDVYAIPAAGTSLTGLRVVHLPSGNNVKLAMPAAGAYARVSSGRAVMAEHLVSGNAGYLGTGTYGVHGVAGSPTDWAGYFEGLGYFSDNVGIGTDTPQSKLHVVGDIRSSASTPALVLTDTNGGGSKPTIRFEGSDRITFVGEDDGPEMFGFYSTFHYDRANDASLQIYGRATGTWGNYLALTHDGTDGHVQTDTGHLLLEPAGNVGIGTTDPGSLLHLASLGGIELTIEADTNNSGGEDQNAGIFLSQDGGLVTGRLGYNFSGEDNALALINYANYPLLLGANSTEYMRVTRDGKVGIGTPSPDEKLQVSGKVRCEQLQVTDGATAGYVLTADGGGNAEWAPNPGGGESLWDQNGNDIHYDAGDVGIGTNAPEARLHVGGAGQQVLIGDAHDAIQPALKLWGGHSSGYAYIQAGGDGGAPAKLRIVKYNTGFDELDELQISAVKSHFSGDVGIGTSTPAMPLHIATSETTNVRIESDAAATRIDLVNTDMGPTGDPQLRFSVNDGTPLFSMGVVDIDDTFRIGTTTPATSSRLVIDPDGNVGLGVNGPACPVHVRNEDPDLRLDMTAGSTAELVELQFAVAGSQMAELGYDRVDETLYLSNRSSGGIKAAELRSDGRFVVDVLQIEGGADLSEHFDIHAEGEAPAPGMVVCIDPDHPGQLSVSQAAYDTRVAGVISGAGGINPGMLMGQRDSLAGGEHPVALTGRVYCLVDATQHAVRPGDLLTTANTPGHAMKVTDHERARGAIIGKAMTPLAGGRGLVLVLVSLQ
jgi:hypothetical protein